MSFFKDYDFGKLIKDVEQSIVLENLPKDYSLSDESIAKYTTEEEYKKYFIEGEDSLVPLSLAIINIFKSGRGYYIVKYAHEYKVNRFVEGFDTKEELFHYAKFIMDESEIVLPQLCESIYSLKEKEDKMTREEIINRNVEYLETELKILQNIFDMEAKAPYCEKLQTLRTVQTEVNNFLEIFQILQPVYLCLKDLGFAS